MKKVNNEKKQFTEQECERLSKELSEHPDKHPKRKCPRCGKIALIKALNRKKVILTIYGEVTYSRHQYYCEACDNTFYPRDHELNIEQKSMSEDVLALAMDFMVNDTFAQASKRMEYHHKITLSETTLQNVFITNTDILLKSDSLVALPLHDFNAHQPVIISNDGSMIQCRDAWHEAKVLSVRTHEESQATYFVETLDNEDLEKQFRSSDGYERLDNRVVLWLADGAPYNWNVQKRLCPHAKPLLDFLHLKHHLYECAKSVLQDEHALVEMFVESAVIRIIRSEAREVISELKECFMEIDNRSKVKKKAFRGLFNYLERNIERLDYGEFLRNGWPIGSGEIESAHKPVLQI